MNEIVDSIDRNIVRKPNFLRDSNLRHVRRIDFCFPMKNFRPQKLEGASREEAKNLPHVAGPCVDDAARRTVARKAVQTAASRAAEG